MCYYSVCVCDTVQGHFTDLVECGILQILAGSWYVCVAICCFWSVLLTTDHKFLPELAHNLAS